MTDDFETVVDEMRHDGRDVVEVAEIVMAMRGFCEAFDNREPGVYSVIVCARGHYHLAGAVAGMFSIEIRIDPEAS